MSFLNTICEIPRFKVDLVDDSNSTPEPDVQNQYVLVMHDFRVLLLGGVMVSASSTFLEKMLSHPVRTWTRMMN